MENREKTRTFTLGNELKKQIVLMYPFVKGNPGNATVMYELYDYNMDGILNLAYSNFGKVHPEYAHENGWLWIIYKNICDKDIQKTILYLEQLAGYRKTPEGDVIEY